jgi:hypothetical protein
MNGIIRYLLDNWPAALWIMLGGIIAWAIFQIKNEVKKANDKSEEVEKKVNSLPCELHQSHHSELREEYRVNITEVKTSIAYIKDSVDILVKNLHSKGALINPYTERQSPMTITKEGYELVDRLCMNDMVNSNWDRASLYLNENLKSVNPYDIQQFLMEHVTVYPLEFIGECDIDKIKRVAYNEGYPLISYLTVIAILIRDKYFSEHHIDIDDIDKNDPDRIV